MFYHLFLSNMNFLLSYLCMVGKELFLSQIFKMEILIDWHILRSPESKNLIFNGWSVCVCLLLAYLKKIRKKKLQHNLKNEESMENSGNSMLWPKDRGKGREFQHLIQNFGKVRESEKILSLEAISCKF